MALFQKPFFKSKNADVEYEYVTGVRHLQYGNMNAASRHLVKAAEGGHTSAFYNLSILWGSGAVSPYDFDAAADCWYKSAAAGHTKAQETLWLLEAADRGGFGAENLVDLVRMQGKNGALLQPSLMICAARFFDVICRRYDATNEVIAYELDCAISSDWNFIHSFVKRTGIERSFYEGGSNRLTKRSVADLVTDQFNDFAAAMGQVGYDQRLIAMARCSIVGYIILKSPYRQNAEPLLGLDAFFN